MNAGTMAGVQPARQPAPERSGHIGNPFPGLRPFREDEEHLFFGRERQVDRMVDKLARTRFLAVVGTSGSGKSSLVNCGLRPALHRGLMSHAGTCWRMVQFRPGGNPIRALAGALAEDGQLFDLPTGKGLSLTDILEATLCMSRSGLTDVLELAHLDPDINLLVVVDQFEELFRYRDTGTRYPATEREAAQDAIAFVNLLLGAVAQMALPVYVVLTMRSDFLGDCAQFCGLPEAISEGQFLVPRLTRQERRAAIAGPVAVAGGAVNPVLLTRLVNDVGDNPDQLSILQHALNRSWASWKKYGREPMLSIADYEAVGTMSHALDRHAETAYRELRDTSQRRICEKLFKTLSDKGTDARGIRRPLEFGHLLDLTGAAEDELIAVMNVFRKPSRSFLMPPLPETPARDTIVDISHESLMRVWERLKQWTDEEAQSARMFRRVSETAALHAMGRAGLWRDPDLSLALEWRRKEEPGEAWATLYQGDFTAAMSFLKTSREVRDSVRAEEEFERRWRRRYAGIATGVIASFFLLSAIYGGAIEEGLHALLAQVAPRLAHSPNEWVERAHSIAAGVLLGMAHLLGFFTIACIARHLYHRKAYDSIVAATRDPADTERKPAVRETQLYAGFFRRAMAALIDLSLFWVGAGAIASLVTWIADVYRPDVYVTILPFGYLGLLATASWLYDALLSSSARQATLGKLAMRLLVQDSRGRRLTFGRATARFFAKYPSWLLLGTGFLMQPFTRKRRALHDLIAGTVVVRRQMRRPYGAAGST